MSRDSLRAADPAAHHHTDIERRRHGRKGCKHRISEGRAAIQHSRRRSRRLNPEDRAGRRTAIQAVATRYRVNAPPITDPRCGSSGATQVPIPAITSIAAKNRLPVKRWTRRRSDHPRTLRAHDQVRADEVLFHGPSGHPGGSRLLKTPQRMKGFRSLIVQRGGAFYCVRLGKGPAVMAPSATKSVVLTRLVCSSSLLTQSSAFPQAAAIQIP